MDHGREWRTRNPSIERHTNAALAVVCKRHSPRRVRKLRIRSFSIYHAQNPIGGTETTKPPMHHRIRGFTRTYSFDTAGTHRATDEGHPAQ